HAAELDARADDAGVRHLRPAGRAVAAFAAEFEGALRADECERRHHRIRNRDAQIHGHVDVAELRRGANDAARETALSVQTIDAEADHPARLRREADREAGIGLEITGERAVAVRRRAPRETADDAEALRIGSDRQ